MKPFNELLNYAILESYFKNNKQSNDINKIKQLNYKTQFENIKKEKIILRQKINELELQNNSIKNTESTLKKNIKKQMEAQIEQEKQHKNELEKQYTSHISEGRK